MEKEEDRDTSYFGRFWRVVFWWESYEDESKTVKMVSVFKEKQQRKSTCKDVDF